MWSGVTAEERRRFCAGENRLSKNTRGWFFDIRSFWGMHLDLYIHFKYILSSYLKSRELQGSVWLVVWCGDSSIFIYYQLVLIRHQIPTFTACLSLGVIRCRCDLLHILLLPGTHTFLWKHPPPPPRIHLSYNGSQSLQRFRCKTLRSNSRVFPCAACFHGHTELVH